MNLTERTSWAARLRTLRARLKLDQEGMGRRLGVSREWVSKLENEKEDFSEFVQLKLRAAEAAQSEPGAHGVVHGALSSTGEAPGDHVDPREKSTPPASGVPVQTGQMLRPEHRPKANEPTIEQCREYMECYLRAAASAPGGIGHAWYQMRRHLRIEDFEIDPPQAED